jgi:hypothetical protein
MRIQTASIFILLLTFVLIGCNQSPFRPEDEWSSITVSLSGTALTDAEITVQTDVEGSSNYTVSPGDLPWNYHQFSFLDDYSIQFHCEPETVGTTGTTTAASSSYNTGTQTVYRITDSSASFTTDVARHDIIFNGAAGTSASIFSVIDDNNLYIYGDENDQNIFDSALYPVPPGRNYTIWSSHELWLQVIVTDSENNKTDTTYHLRDYTIDLQLTN